METEKVGMREFRENLAGYLEGGRPLAITRHGETLGFFLPAPPREGRKAAVESARAAAKEFDDMVSARGLTAQDLLADYDEILQSESREKQPVGR